jgi:DNA-binding IscR family transcriptional regulator
MRRDSRLSVALHALLHMADAGLLTSEAMAAQGDTNPVVIRRTMAGLRAVGIVRSEKGHGGGWSLVRRLDEITLYDVYEALGEPTILAIGTRTESPGCVVEKAVNHALKDAFASAEALLIKRLKSVSMASLAREVGPHARHHTKKKVNHA